LRVEVVPERAGLGVARPIEGLGDAVLAADKPAALVRGVLAGVSQELVVDLLGNPHRQKISRRRRPRAAAARSGLPPRRRSGSGRRGPPPRAGRPAPAARSSPARPPP